MQRNEDQMQIFHYIAIREILELIRECTNCNLDKIIGNLPAINGCLDARYQMAEHIACSIRGANTLFSQFPQWTMPSIKPPMLFLSL